MRKTPVICKTLSLLLTVKNHNLLVLFAKRQFGKQYDNSEILEKAEASSQPISRGGSISQLDPKEMKGLMKNTNDNNVSPIV